MLMKRFSLLMLSAIVAGTFSACNENAESENAETTVPAEVAKTGPQLIPVSTSPEYDGASLKIGAIKSQPVGKDSAKLHFDFDVANYELKAQTADNGTKMCNNSGQGQHIHFIMDNAPYKALYEPQNDITLANNTEHYLMAFLSRSYHESVKSAGAAVVLHFKIDEKGKYVKMDDPATPMVFYSRPKGDYLGADTANVLLDYYIWNCQLSPDSYKVVATIAPATGETVSMSLDKWEPNFITGLPMGKNKITITLTDQNGKQIDGMHTAVEREFTLAADEPMK